jgi:hypothetical protein
MKGEGKTGEGIVCGTVLLICHSGFSHQSEAKHSRHSMNKLVAAQGVEIGLPLQLLFVVSGSVTGIMPKSCTQERFLNL